MANITDSDSKALKAHVMFNTPVAADITAERLFVGTENWDEVYPARWVYSLTGSFTGLDHHHWLRTAMRNLRYVTRSILMGQRTDVHDGGDSAGVLTAAWSDLMDLRRFMQEHGHNCPYTADDLLTSLLFDQSTDAAERIFSRLACAALREHGTKSANGTLLFLEAFTRLHAPYRADFEGSPVHAVRSAACGLAILRYARCYIELKKLPLNPPRGGRKGSSWTPCLQTDAEFAFQCVVNSLLLWHMNPTWRALGWRRAVAAIRELASQPCGTFFSMMRGSSSDRVPSMDTFVSKAARTQLLADLCVELRQRFGMDQAVNEDKRARLLALMDKTLDDVPF